MGVGSGGVELNLPIALQHVGVPGTDVLGRSCASSGLPPCERPDKASSLLPPLRRCFLKRGGCQITAAFSPRCEQPGLGSCLFFFPRTLQKGLLLLQKYIEIRSRDVGLNIHQPHFPNSRRDRSQPWHRNSFSGHRHSVAPRADVPEKRRRWRGAGIDRPRPQRQRLLEQWPQRKGSVCLLRAERSPFPY